MTTLHTSLTNKRASVIALLSSNMYICKFHLLRQWPPVELGRRNQTLVKEQHSETMLHWTILYPHPHNSARHYNVPFFHRVSSSPTQYYPFTGVEVSTSGGFVQFWIPVADFFPIIFLTFNTKFDISTLIRVSIWSMNWLIYLYQLTFDYFTSNN